MSKRKGRLLQELSIVERVRTGYSALKKMELIQPNSPIVVHRRQLKGMTSYDAKDPREQYAVPDSEIHGTLPERIFFKQMKDRRLVNGVDFTFQSSQVGGRLHLGGMVVDFLFERPKLAVRIQGEHWHGQFDRINGDLLSGDIVQGRRDDEQGQILEEMNYTVMDLWEGTCYDQYLLKFWMERWFDPLLMGVMVS